MSGRKLRRAGSPWRVLAHDKDGESFSVEHSHTEFDELVVGKFCHIEQMDTGKWWCNFGGVTLWVRAGRDGRPVSVDVYGPNDYDEPVDGCAYTVTWTEEENAELNRQILVNQKLARELQAAQDERDRLAAKLKLAEEHIADLEFALGEDEGKPEASAVKAFSDVDVAAEEGVIKLYGNGDKLIADLPGDRAEILRDMLGDSIKTRAKQRELMAAKGSEAP